MRNVKVINELSAAASGVEFPKSNIRFQNFKRTLQGLIRDNFGPVLAESMEYDDDKCDFYFQVKECIGHLLGTALYVENTFSINPNNDLMEEFKKLERDMEAFQERKTIIKRALIGAGGDL